MRARHGLFLVMVIASYIATPSSRAQSVSTSAEVHTESGLHRVLFRVKEGTIRVNYPDDMAAGDTISGTVYTEPREDPERTRQERRRVGICDRERRSEKSTASEKRFKWVVPAKVAGRLSAVLLRDRQGSVVARSVRAGSIRRRQPMGIGLIRPAIRAEAGKLVSASVPVSPELGSSVTVGGVNAPRNCRISPKSCFPYSAGCCWSVPILRA